MDEYRIGLPIALRKKVDLKKEAGKYTRRWLWFLGALIIALAIAYTYIIFSVPVYNTKTTFIVRTDEQNRSGPEISAFLDLNRLNRMRSSSMDNELGVLRSRRLLKNTIQALQLEVGYYKEGKMGHEVELYNQSPIMARSLGKQSLAVAKKTPMATQRAVINNSDAGFSIQLDGSDEVIAGAFGEPLQLPFGEYVFSLNEKDNVADFPVILSFEDLENLITKYESLLTIDLVDKNSSHVEIDLEYPNKKKAQDILDQMVLEYNTEARNDKALLVDITGNFIGQRLQELDNGFTDSIKENNGFKWLETMLAAEADLDLDNAFKVVFDRILGRNNLHVD